jgi:hypothetical protein
MTHNIKIESQYFERVLDGTKTFEIRKNDRGYQSGDTVNLIEVDSIGVTGREATFKIGFVTDFMQDNGYVVFSLLKVSV